MHNLEHGDVVILYDCADHDCAPEFLDQLRAVYADASQSRFGTTKLVITPFPGLGPRLMAIAWDVQHDYDVFDRDAILSFYARHMGQGPEDEP